MVGGSVAVGIVFLMIVMQHRLRAELHHAPHRPRSGADEQDPSALGAKGIGYQLQSAAPRSAWTPARSPRPASRSPAPACSAARSPASRCSTTGSSAHRTSSSRSPTSARSRVSSSRRSSRSRASTRAQVDLVIPNQQEQLFADNSQAASASVLLSAPEPRPELGQGHRAARRLERPGLTVDKVTITDGTGAALWPAPKRQREHGGCRGAGGQQQYDEMMAANVDAVLAQMLGPGKAQAWSARPQRQPGHATVADLQRQGRPADEADLERVARRAAAARAAGAAGTIPAAGAPAGIEAPTTRTRPPTPPTASTRRSPRDDRPRRDQVPEVSVLVGRTVRPRRCRRSRRRSAGAVGLNAKRGDTIVGLAARRSSRPRRRRRPRAGTSKMIGYAKDGVIGLGALLFLIFIARALKRRERETSPADLAERVRAPAPAGRAREVVASSDGVRVKRCGRGEPGEAPGRGPGRA